MFALIGRLLLFCLLPFALLFFANAMPGLAPAWDFANAAGLLCGVLLLLLFVYSGRPLARPHYDGKFFMMLHRDLGYAVLLLLLLHVGVLLFSEPLVWNYLLPSASWSMLSGTLAAVLLVLLVPISLPSIRQRIWRHHVRFRRWHYGLSAAVLVLLAVHMLSVGFYTEGLWKMLLWLGLTGAALLWPLLPRRGPGRGDGPRRRHTAIFAHWLSVAVLAFSVLLAAAFALLANVDLPL